MKLLKQWTTKQPCMKSSTLILCRSIISKRNYLTSQASITLDSSIMTMKILLLWLKASRWTTWRHVIKNPMWTLIVLSIKCPMICIWGRWGGATPDPWCRLLPGSRTRTCLLWTCILIEVRWGSLRTLAGSATAIATQETLTYKMAGKFRTRKCRFCNGVNVMERVADSSRVILKRTFDSNLKRILSYKVFQNGGCHFGVFTGFRCFNGLLLIWMSILNYRISIELFVWNEITESNRLWCVIRSCSTK